MSRPACLILLPLVASCAGSCSESYKFQENTDVDVNVSSAVDNGPIDQNLEECTGKCLADGQSSGGS
jgi:hypothetical protein